MYTANPPGHLSARLRNSQMYTTLPLPVHLRIFAGQMHTPSLPTCGYRFWDSGGPSRGGIGSPGYPAYLRGLLRASWGRAARRPIPPGYGPPGDAWLAPRATGRLGATSFRGLDNIRTYGSAIVVVRRRLGSPRITQGSRLGLG